MRLIKNIVSNSLLFLFSITATLLLCEVGFRTYVWVIDPKIGPQTQAFISVRAKSNRVYQYRKNSKNFLTNSMSFRDREFEVFDDDFKVVMLGDSIMSAMELPPDDSVPSNLDVILNSQLNQSVRVFNLGTTGYNAAQNFATLDEVGLALNPDIVVLNLCLNDSDPVLRRHKRGLIVTAEISNFSDINLRTIVGSSYVLTFLKKQVIALIYNSNPKLIAQLNDPQLIINQRVEESAWSDMKDYVVRTRDLAVADGADFFVAIYPYASQVGLPPAELLPQRDLQSYFDDHGIASIDLAGTYESSEEDMFVDKTLHLNAHGTQRVAETLARELNQRFITKSDVAETPLQEPAENL
jgi:lysophospholipase L1-like esterase